MKNILFWGRGGGGNKLIASEKLIKVYLLWPIRYRLNKYKVPMKKNNKKKQGNTHTHTYTHTHLWWFVGTGSQTDSTRTT